MKLTMRLLLAIAIFYAPLSYGYESIEIEELEDVADYLEENSLVVFGGLDTLFRTKNPGRWPYQWEASLAHMGAKHGYQKQTKQGPKLSRTIAEKDLRQLYPFQPDFEPTSENIYNIIQQIRETNSKVVCITHLRPFCSGDVNAGITQCLNGCNVDLAADWQDLAPNVQFTTATPFLNGIVHASSMDKDAPKRTLKELLPLFIAFTGLEFDNIIVIDDEEDNLTEYGTAADELGVDCTCLLFRKQHIAPAGFKLSRTLKELLPKRKGTITEKKAADVRKKARIEGTKAAQAEAESDTEQDT